MNPNQAPCLESLKSALGRMADDLERQAVPALPARVRSAVPARRGWHRLVSLNWPGMLADAGLCSVIVLVSVGWLLFTGPGPDDVGRPAHRGGTPVEAISGFMAVAAPDRWQRLTHAGEPLAAWVVPSDMPRERLAALGLPFDPARAGDSVRAELLIHASGEVLAVRVVQH